MPGPPGCLWSEEQTLARWGLEGAGHRFQTGRRGGDRPGRKYLKMRHWFGDKHPRKDRPILRAIKKE